MATSWLVCWHFRHLREDLGEMHGASPGSDAWALDPLWVLVQWKCC